MAPRLHAPGHSASGPGALPLPPGTQFPGLAPTRRLVPPRRASQHLPLQMAQSGGASGPHQPIGSC